MDSMKEFCSREIHFTRDHVKEFSSREMGSIDFTGVITPREMNGYHHYRQQSPFLAVLLSWRAIFVEVGNTRNAARAPPRSGETHRWSSGVTVELLSKWRLRQGRVYREGWDSRADEEAGGVYHRGRDGWHMRIIWC